MNDVLIDVREPFALASVHIAGSLVLVTIAATALAGQGPVFAGVGDLCVMASLLGLLPWNRSARQAA